VRTKRILILLIAAVTFAAAASLRAQQNQGGAAADPPEGRGARGGRGSGGAAGRGGLRGPSGPLPRLSDGHPDLTGIWTGIGFSGRAPEILPWAAKVIADHAAKQGAEDFEARCLPGGPPRMAPYHTALFATPKEVVILFEGNTHMYRQIFVDGSDHPKGLKPTFYGDSRGHWEGDWLVVDTIGFNTISWYDFAGTPHTKDMHLIEKFHRIDYGNLEEEATIEDPGVFPKPWTQRKNIALDPSFEMTEYVCNENNQDPEHLDALLKDSNSPAAVADRSKGVPPPQPRKAPAPPSGATPRTENGKIDFSGVWVPVSTLLPSDPSYQPSAKKLYDERKANKGKDDPERFCLPDGAVRINPLPYKMIQRPDTVLVLGEGNTHKLPAHLPRRPQTKSGRRTRELYRSGERPMGRRHAGR
jgi:hypothetical protein